MSQLNVLLPEQRLSYKEKSKDNFKWSRDCIDAIAQRMYQYNGEGEKYHSDIQRKLVNYRLYNNQLDQSDFDQDCNPFGLTADEFKDKIQPYNKLHTKVQVLLGEELKRPFNLRTYLLNNSASNSYTRAKTELQRKYLQQTLDQEVYKYKAMLAEQMGNPETDEELQQMQQAIEQEANRIMSPEMIEKYMKTEWRDAVEIMMDQLLQWFNKELKIKKLKNTGFKHALIAAEEFAWVGIINGKPVVELLNPLKMFCHKSSETEYVQDGFYAGYRTRMTPADALDRFGDDLTEADKDKIDQTQAISNLYGITTDFLTKGPNVELKGLNKSLEWRMSKGAGGIQDIGSYGASTLNDIDVVHVEWRSQRKFGFLTYIDENGEEQLDLLDESFKVPDTASRVKYKDKYGTNKTKYVWVVDESPYELEWTWLPEVWEGTRIASDVYVNVRPKPYQARSLKDPYKVKLGYHGLIYNAMNAPNISFFDRGKPFQYLYFILMHKMKEIIAKDMPPLTSIDMSMIPKTLTNEQWLYYYKQGLGFYDPNQNNEGNPQNVSGQKGPAFSVDRSVMAHVNQYIELLAYVDEQINQVTGVSRGREGGASAYEAVSNTQQNITQSSHITEILFQAHNNLWEEIMTSLLETAQLCFKDEPTKIPVVLDDMSRTVLELLPEYFTDAEMGVFLVDDPNDPQNLEQMRSMAMSFAQNGGTISDITKLYRATSMEALERESEAIEDSRQKAQQQQEQMSLESNERLKQMEIEAEDIRHQHELEQIDRKGMWDLRKAELTSLGIDEGSNVEDILAQADLAVKEAKVMTDAALKEREVNNNERSQQFEEVKHSSELQEKEKDRELKREELKSKEKIARSRPKPTTKKK